MTVNEDFIRNMEQNLSYWKAHISVHDMLTSELAYSLIYDNIRSDKVSEAMGTVGLDVLPNRFFLIQVDDYMNYSSNLHITQEFFQKPVLVDMLRTCMKMIKLKGFVANLIGMDRIICFLCFEEHETEDPGVYLRSVAETFKEYVRHRSTYTISVCISRRCTQLDHYAKLYPLMDLALSKSYFSNKEFSILLDEMEEQKELKTVYVDLNARYPEFIASIARRNREQFEQVLQEMIQALLETQSRPRRVRMEIIRLLQRVEDYCIRCGVPEKQMRDYNETAMNKVLSCSFIADTRNYLEEYYEQVTVMLERYSYEWEYSFKSLVEEYISVHFHEKIRLGTLAYIMGYSEGHFARIFRKQFGITFVQYLTQYRINQSKRLLIETHIPVEQIAFQVGIGSYSYFCTCFKNACGLTPSKYRKHYYHRAGKQNIKIMK
ncbi:MAG: helix-turn-helix transcriptional regulator [Gracilibacteraceae bacterium]|jgi:AraC-like DNA-binding protein|nr:helix-turn-helix transcriptional regulator [Gracilibacteraceae bacterium]